MLRAVAAVITLGWIACAAPAELSADWVEQRQAGLIRFRSEFSLRGSERLLEELGGLRNDLQATLGLTIPDAPIEVNLFASKRSYQAHLARRVPAGASRQALFVKGPDTGRVYVYRHQDFETDVRHESTHALIHNALPFIPLWLDEGLAEYFEVPRDDRPSRNPHLSDLRWAIRFGARPSLASLEAKRNLTEFKGSDYRDAWAWVHFLLHGPEEGRNVLVWYVGQIAAGNPPGALSTHVYKAVPDADEQMLRHFRNWSR